jgi:hypothetical protein
MSLWPFFNEIKSPFTAKRLKPRMPSIESRTCRFGAVRRMGVAQLSVRTVP